MLQKLKKFCVNHNKLTNNFSIIAGKYRSRKLQFIGDQTLRPTPHRIRETLFNWLNLQLNGKIILDCFAGSGALGFEAISRGAKSVFLLEKNSKTAKQIQSNIKTLKDENIQVINIDIFNHKFNQIFDFVFLDPPFNKNLINKTLEFLLKNNAINDETIIYIESEYKVEMENLPFACKITKQKKASSVFYCLIKML